MLQSALKHDYIGFVRKEMSYRLNPTYPPLVRLINVVITSPDNECAADNIEMAIRFLAVASKRMSIADQVGVVGPAPCPIEKIQDRWRWHFLVRSASVSALNQLIGPLTKEFKTKGRDVRLIVDRDPSSLL